MQFFRLLRVSACRESGVTLVETLVVVALLGIIAIAFLNGLITTSKAVAISNERAKAESLAQSQMECIKNNDYIYEATEYSSAAIPIDKGYVNYSAMIAAEPLHNPDSGIQEITITITHSGEPVIKLSNYKVDR